MTVLPDPPDRSDTAAVDMWLAVFDRWYAGMDQRLRADEMTAGWRWSAERKVTP